MSRQKAMDSSEAVGSTVLKKLLTLVLAAVVLFLSNINTSKAGELELYWQEVKKLYREGKELVGQKAYKQALVKFNLAADLLKKIHSKSKSTAEKSKAKQKLAGLYYIIGRTYEFTSDWMKSYKHYKQSLKLSPPKKVADLVKKRLAAVRKKLLAQVRVVTKPEGARVEIRDTEGNKFSKTTPAKFEVISGKINISITKKGYHPIEDTYNLERGERAKLAYRLTKVEKKKPLKAVIKKVETKKLKPPTGTGAVSPPSKGAGGLEKKLVTKGSYPLFFSGLGVGVAATAAGVVMLIIGNNQLTTVDKAIKEPSTFWTNRCKNLNTDQKGIAECTKKLVGIYDSGKALQIAGIASIAGGIAITAVTLLFLRPKKVYLAPGGKTAFGYPPQPTRRERALLKFNSKGSGARLFTLK